MRVYEPLPFACEGYHDLYARHLALWPRFPLGIYVSHLTVDGALLLRRGHAAHAQTLVSTCLTIAYAAFLQELAEPRLVHGLDGPHRPSRVLFQAYEPPSDRFDDDCSL